MTLLPASTRGPVEVTTADYKRAAAVLLHTVGPEADIEGLNAVLAEANDADEGDGRTAQLLVGVLRLAVGLCPDLVSTENVAALHRVISYGSWLAEHGITGLEDADDVA